MSPRTPRIAASVLALVALGSSTALAAGGGGDGAHHAPGFSSLLWYFVNFSLFVGLIAWRVKQPIQDMLIERRAQALAEIEKAQAARKEAEAALAAYKEKLAELEAESAAMLAEAKEVAAAERDRILDNARATAERIQREATFTVEQEIKRAKLELEREVAHRVATEAARAVSEAMSDEDQVRLVDEFVAKEVAS